MGTERANVQLIAYVTESERAALVEYARANDRTISAALRIALRKLLQGQDGEK
jgi:hypothetical protein